MTTESKDQNEHVVSNGRVVSFAYTLRLDDGEEIDSAGSDDPLVYLHGAGNIISGLERELEGLTVGDARTIRVPAADAYGDLDPDAFEEVALDFFPPDMDLEEGMPLSLFDESTGHTIEATLAEITEDGAVLDLNHPLAGEDLSFEIEILDVRAATSDEMAHGHAHGAHSHH